MMGSIATGVYSDTFVDQRVYYDALVVCFTSRSNPYHTQTNPKEERFSSVEVDVI